MEILCPWIIYSFLDPQGGSSEQKRLSRRVEQLQNDLEDKDRELERKQQVLQCAQTKKTHARQRVARIKQTLLTTHAKTTWLLKAKNELEVELKLKKQELMFLEALHKSNIEKEQLTKEDLKFTIQNKEAEIKRLQDQVQDLDGQLKSERKEAIQLREELSQATKDLERKSGQVWELERTRSELRSDLENERKRVDMLLMQTTAATISKEDHIKEIEV